MKPKPAKTPRASAVKKVAKAVLRWTCEVDNKATLGEQCWCLPATPEAYEAQVESVAKGMWESKHARHRFGKWNKVSQEFRDRAKDMARDGLTALGIRQPRPARSRK